MSEWEWVNVHQEFERNWWGKCVNTLSEELKQLDYAPKMGLEFIWASPGPYIDLQGKSVIDIGGGPVSLLLKCINVTNPTVVDPCDYPHWVEERYKEAGITYLKVKAEDVPLDAVYDECWIYNVLQHTEDPAKIVANIRQISKIIRVFDWLEISGIGHPQYLTEEKMNEWYGGEGTVNVGNGGKEYFGFFPGNNFG